MYKFKPKSTYILINIIFKQKPIANILFEKSEFNAAQRCFYKRFWQQCIFLVVFAAVLVNIFILAFKMIVQ